MGKKDERLCVALLGDEAQGQDIAQDVFVAAYEAMIRLGRDFARRIHIRPWLFAIARNKCKQYWRNTRRRSVILHTSRQSIAQSAHGTEDGHQGQELAYEHEQREQQRVDRLLACLQELKHRERTLITSRYSGEKLSCAALAKQFWVSEATVRRRLKAIEDKLRACIEREG